MTCARYSSCPRSLTARPALEELIAHHGLKLKTAGQVLEAEKTKKWDIHSFTMEGYLTMLSAAPGLGKSLLGSKFINIHVNGGDWAGHTVAADPDYLALVLDWEGGEMMALERLMAQGMTMDQINNHVVFAE